MMETWHPLGVCGVISAFNFPVAVWSWNAALAVVWLVQVAWRVARSDSSELPAEAAKGAAKDTDNLLLKG